MTGTTAAPQPSTVRPVALVVVLCGAQFLVVLDSLAVALALPAIGADLRLGPSELAWVVNGYSLALAGGLLLGGRISDVHGRRRVLLAGLTVLTAGAVLAGVAPDARLLLAARVLQGLGAALTYPPALALTGECFPADPWRSRAFAAGAVAGASGTVGGAVFGGAVTGALGWPWVFLLTAPPGLLLVGIGALVLPGATRPRARRPLDLPGAALAAGALAATVFALTRLEHRRATDPTVLGVAAAAAGLLLALAAWERRAVDPLVPGGLLRSRRLLGGCVGIAANSALYSAVVFVGALHLQRELGLDPARAGLAFLPVSLAGLLAGLLLVTPLRRRYGSVPVAAGGLGLGAAALLLLAAAPTAPSYPRHLLPALLLAGLALTAAFVSLTEHTMAADEQHGGVSAGLFETSTHLGGAASVATYAALLGTTGGYRAAYLAAAGLTVAGAALSLALLRGTGQVRQLAAREDARQPLLDRSDHGQDGGRRRA